MFFLKNQTDTERVGAFFSSSDVSIDSLKNIFQSNSAPPTFLEEVSSQMTMSYTKRILAFFVCLIVGLSLIFLSTWFILIPHSFAKFYTVGNLLLLGSSFFLMGPWRQLQTMFASNRIITTLIYLGAMFGTLYCALILHSVFLSIFMIVIQMGATLWYCASYISFFQMCLRTTAGSILPV